MKLAIDECVMSAEDTFDFIYHDKLFNLLISPGRPIPLEGKSVLISKLEYLPLNPETIYLPDGRVFAEQISNLNDIIMQTNKVGNMVYYLGNFIEVTESLKDSRYCELLPCIQIKSN